jgi:hypothetical protein
MSLPWVNRVYILREAGRKDHEATVESFAGESVAIPLFDHHMCTR